MVCEQEAAQKCTTNLAAYWKLADNERSKEKLYNQHSLTIEALQ